MATFEELMIELDALLTQPSRPESGPSLPDLTGIRKERARQRTGSHVQGLMKRALDYRDAVRSEPGKMDRDLEMAARIAAPGVVSMGTDMGRLAEERQNADTLPPYVRQRAFEAETADVPRYDPALIPLMMLPGTGRLGKVNPAARASGSVLRSPGARAAGLGAGGAVVGSAIADSAEAGEPSADDPVRKALMEQIAAQQAVIDEAGAAAAEEAKDGRGPRYKAAIERRDAALKQLERLTGELRSYRTEDELSDKKSGRYLMMAAGAGLGASASLLPTLAKRSLRTRDVKKFGELADMARAAPAPVLGTSSADDVAAIVNEAYSRGGARQPFTRLSKGGKSVGKVRERPVDDADLFKKPPPLAGDYLLPGGMMLESGVTGARGFLPEGTPGAAETPEERELYQNLSLAGLAGLTGYKLAGMGRSAVMPKPRATDLVAITAKKAALSRAIDPRVQSRVAAKAVGQGATAGGRGNALMTAAADAVTGIPTALLDRVGAAGRAMKRKTALTEYRDVNADRVERVRSAIGAQLAIRKARGKLSPKAAQVPAPVGGNAGGGAPAPVPGGGAGPKGIPVGGQGPGLRQRRPTYGAPERTAAKPFIEAEIAAGRGVPKSADVEAFLTAQGIVSQLPKDFQKRLDRMQSVVDGAKAKGMSDAKAAEFAVSLMGDKRMGTTYPAIAATAGAGAYLSSSSETKAAPTPWGARDPASGRWTRSPKTRSGTGKALSPTASAVAKALSGQRD